MNNKGFTLIELTAIIVVLAAIFLVSFPSLINTAKSDEEKNYDDMVQNLCLAGESYIYANTDEFKELSIVNSKIIINIKELIEYGNVDSDLTNPNTKTSVINDDLIYTVLSDYSLDCQYQLDDGKVTLVQYITDLYSPNTTSLSVDGITYNVDTTHGLMNDRLGSASVGADDGNIRYYGATPKNYIDIGDRDSDGNVILWRIIGVFKDVQVTDENGNVTGIEDLVKISRANLIGYYSWDYTASGEYDGNWSDATLKTLLNGAYYNSGTTIDYDGSLNKEETHNFYEVGLSQSARNKVQSVVWNIGGYNVNLYDENITSHAYPNDFYSYERGNLRADESYDLTWNGKIALMYPSDYGYASDLTQCNKDLTNYNTTTCSGTNWLFNNLPEWTLTPYSIFKSNAVQLHLYGYISYEAVSESTHVKPVLYLKSDTLITNEGDGSQNTPYVIK